MWRTGHKSRYTKFDRNQWRDRGMSDYKSLLVAGTNSKKCGKQMPSVLAFVYIINLSMVTKSFRTCQSNNIRVAEQSLQRIDNNLTYTGFSWKQHWRLGFVFQIGFPKAKLKFSFFKNFHEKEQCRCKQDEYPEHKQR
jgi:hypothetical protein